MIENINDFFSVVTMAAIVVVMVYITFTNFAHEHHIRRYEKEVEYYSEFYEED